MAAVLTLVASQTLAITSIKNTKHDLSKNSSAAIKSTSDDYDEICVFCHTPHTAVANDNAPLWNRILSVDATTDITKYYNSATIEDATKQALVDDAIIASDAPLCLSCHDGSSLTDALKNPPNTLTGQAGAPAGLVEITGPANIGVELHDDHPIGMIYDDVVTQSPAGEFNASASGKVGSLNLYTTDGVMWCSSCHDVHDNDYMPFLASDNTGSTLCLVCHNK